MRLPCWLAALSPKACLAASALAFGLTVGTAAEVLAANTHSHGGPGTSIELVLNNGAKWEADEALRRGMADVRNDMTAALPRIHGGEFTPAEYAELAAKIDGLITYLVENCKLTPEADEQLHVVLVEFMDGAAAMKSDVDQSQGAVKIIQALDVYPEYFDHPGWQPLGD